MAAFWAFIIDHWEAIWAAIKRLKRPRVWGSVVGVLVVFGVGLAATGPVLLQTRWPVIQFHFPVEFSNLSCCSDSNNLQVLIQRKVVFINRWAVSDNPTVDCAPNTPPLKCDETHILESWTVLVPEDPQKSPLKTRTFLDQYGRDKADPRVLSGQTMHMLDPPGAQLRNWEIVPQSHQDMDTDLILLKRVIMGTFQPGEADKRFPSAGPCTGNQIGVSLRNTTNTAELMFTTAPDAPAIDPSSVSLFKVIGQNKPAAVGTDVAGQPTVADGHTLSWFVNPKFLHELTATTDPDVSLWIVWNWQTPITTGPRCKSH